MACGCQSWQNEQTRYWQRFAWTHLFKTTEQTHETWVKRNCFYWSVTAAAAATFDTWSLYWCALVSADRWPIENSMMKCHLRHFGNWSCIGLPISNHKIEISLDMLCVRSRCDSHSYQWDSFRPQSHCVEGVWKPPKWYSKEFMRLIHFHRCFLYRECLWEFRFVSIQDSYSNG